MRSVLLVLLLVATLVLVSSCQVDTTQDSETATATGSITTSIATGEAPVEAPTLMSDPEDSTFVSPLSTPGSDSEDTALLSPLPTPVEDTAGVHTPAAGEEPGEVPTPSSQDVGVATGYFLGGDPPLPAAGVILYLADVLVGSDGTPLSASLDKQTAPRTLVDESGQFAFADVSPGRYALLLDLVTSTVVLRHPDTGGDLLIDVGGGEITDLGKLVYPDLPLLP